VNRRIASPSSGATETTRTLADVSVTGWVSIESVTSSVEIALSSRRRIVSSVNTPCVIAASTRLAPRSISTAATSASVPPVTVKSSTISAVLPATSPIRWLIARAPCRSSRCFSAIASGDPSAAA
jgi:hypothetical protein